MRTSGGSAADDRVSAVRRASTAGLAVLVLDPGLALVVRELLRKPPDLGFELIQLLGGIVLAAGAVGGTLRARRRAADSGQVQRRIAAWIGPALAVVLTAMGLWLALLAAHRSVFGWVLVVPAAVGAAVATVSRMPRA